MSDSVELAIAANVIEKNRGEDAIKTGALVAKAIRNYREGLREDSPNHLKYLLEYFVRLARTNHGARQTADIFKDENIEIAIKEAECALGGLIPVVEWSELSDDAPGEDIDMSAHHPDLDLGCSITGKTYDEVVDKFNEYMFEKVGVS